MKIASSLMLVGCGASIGFLLAWLVPLVFKGHSAVSKLKEPLEIQATSEQALAHGPFLLPPGTTLRFEEKTGPDTAIYSMRVEVRGDQLQATGRGTSGDLPPLVAVKDPASDERLPARAP